MDDWILPIHFLVHPLCHAQIHMDQNRSVFYSHWQQSQHTNISENKHHLMVHQNVHYLQVHGLQLLQQNHKSIGLLSHNKTQMVWKLGLLVFHA